MRLYVKADEAFEEIKRDLAEMGIWVRPKTMQDKNIEGNPEYETTELQNYCYTILNAKSSEILYKNTYKDSSWNSFIHNRVCLSYALLQDTI